jgi:hypothetical protein
MGSQNTEIANQAQLQNIANQMKAAEFNAGNVNQANLFNANATNQANQLNSNRQMSALEGMRGLYGTTPAMSALFGNQAMQSAGMQNQMDQDRMANMFRLISQGTNALPRF